MPGMTGPGADAPWLVLASASPRRRRLLLEHGVEHLVEAPPLDDAALDPGDASPEKWVAALAHLKAAATERRLRRQGRGPYVVLGADTVVVKSGVVIGQPTDAADAERIIRLLAGGEHDVLTGVAILTPEGHPASTLATARMLFTDSAHVRVGPLSEEQISRYIASDGWRGKAGGYNLAERLTDGWPITYTGDPGTIMGLPMERLAPVLRRLRPAETPR